MDYYSRLRKAENISLAEAINLLIPIFMKMHVWNTDDKLADVWNRKSDHVERITLSQIGSGKIRGERVWFYDLDENGVPLSDLEYVDYEKSWVNLKDMLTSCYNSVVTKYEYIPDDFKLLLPEMFKEAGDDTVMHAAEVAPKTEPVACAAEDGYGDDENIDDESLDVKDMALPILRKKVKELSNEKVKWDKSIATAAKIGLLFYEKGLAKPATEKAFKEEYAKEFEKIPNTTVTMIYKSLPNEYRNRGERPVEKAGILDEDMVDTILEASVVAGFITKKEGARNLSDLKDRLEGDDVVVPSDDYMKRIAGTCKRVALKYN